MTRIVTTRYRYKRSLRKKLAVTLEARAAVARLANAANRRPRPHRQPTMTGSPPPPPASALARTLPGLTTDGMRWGSRHS